MLALEKLTCIIDMTNETVGDAYSDMLIVETVLCERGWSLSDWYGTYSDLPNRLTKVTVKVINTQIHLISNDMYTIIFVFIRTEMHLKQVMRKEFVSSHWAYKK